MTGRRLIALTALPALCALTLTGCQFSSSDDAASTAAPTTSSSTTSSSTSPTPTVVTSSAKGSTQGRQKEFALVVPTGWKDTTSKHSSKKHGSSVMFLQSKSESGHVYPTFNVIRQSPDPLPELEDVLKQAKISLRQEGAEVSAAPDRTIGGEPAKGYVITRTANGDKIVQTQYFVVHLDAVYTTTMTSDADRRGQADQTQEAILSTWSWSTA